MKIKPSSARPGARRRPFLGTAWRAAALVGASACWVSGCGGGAGEFGSNPPPPDVPTGYTLVEAHFTAPVVKGLCYTNYNLPKEVFGVTDEQGTFQALSTGGWTNFYVSYIGDRCDPLQSTKVGGYYAEPGQEPPIQAYSYAAADQPLRTNYVLAMMNHAPADAGYLDVGGLTYDAATSKALRLYVIDNLIAPYASEWEFLAAMQQKITPPAGSQFTTVPTAALMPAVAGQLIEDAVALELQTDGSANFYNYAVDYGDESDWNIDPMLIVNLDESAASFVRMTVQPGNRRWLRASSDNADMGAYPPRRSPIRMATLAPVPANLTNSPNAVGFLDTGTPPAYEQMVLSLGSFFLSQYHGTDAAGQPYTTDHMGQRVKYLVPGIVAGETMTIANGRRCADGQVIDDVWQFSADGTQVQRLSVPGQPAMHVETAEVPGILKLTTPGSPMVSYFTIDTNATVGMADVAVHLIRPVADPALDADTRPYMLARTMAPLATAPTCAP